VLDFRQFFGKSLAYLEMEMAGMLVMPGVGSKGEILQRPDRLEGVYRPGSRLAGKSAHAGTSGG